MKHDTIYPYKQVAQIYISQCVMSWNIHTMFTLPYSIQLCVMCQMFKSKINWCDNVWVLSEPLCHTQQLLQNTEDTWRPISCVACPQVFIEKSDEKLRKRDRLEAQTKYRCSEAESLTNRNLFVMSWIGKDSDLLSCLLILVTKGLWHLYQRKSRSLAQDMNWGAVPKPSRPSERPMRGFLDSQRFQYAWHALLGQFSWACPICFFVFSKFPLHFLFREAAQRSRKESIARSLVKISIPIYDIFYMYVDNERDRDRFNSLCWGGSGWQHSWFTTTAVNERLGVGAA